MRQADLRDCLTDPAYQYLDRPSRDRLKFHPHQVLYHRRDNRLVVLLKRGGTDYSANTDMIKSLSDLQSSGKVTEGYLAQRNGDEIVASQTVLNVARKINGYPPNDGEYGPFHWLREGTFEVVRGSLTLSDDDLPF